MIHFFHLLHCRCFDESHFSTASYKFQLLKLNLFKINKYMAAVKPLDKEITHYLGQLSIRQKEVVLSVVKTFAGEEEFLWDDKNYIAAMDKLFAEMESGKVKGFTLEQMEAGARQAYKNRKLKKG
jgi:hypothetical protein